MKIEFENVLDSSRMGGYGLGEFQEVLPVSIFWVHRLAVFQNL